MRRVFEFIIAVALGTAVTFAQGGKAEPGRIRFTSGQSSAAVSGRLANGQEAEYVFTATGGQHVTIRNATKNLFDFRVFKQEIDFETEFESSPTLSFEVPETGDYLFFVRKKMVRSPRSARYTLTISIK